MQLNIERVDRAKVQARIDGWLKAELDEDAYRRDAPEGELFAGVVLRSEPVWKADSVVRRVSYDDVAAADDLVDPFGPIAQGEYFRKDVSDLDLARETQTKVFSEAAERHRLEEESVAEEHVKALFDRYGIPVDEFSAKFETATHMMMRAHRDLWIAVQARDSSGWRPHLDDDPASAVISRLAATVPVSAPSPDAAEAHFGRETLTWAEAEFLAEGAREGLSSGRSGEFQVAFRIFREWLGRDACLQEITPSIAGDFRLALGGMPSNGSKRPEYRDLAPLARIERAREIGEEHLLSSVTIGGNYINPLRSLFEWARSAGKVHENPFANIRAPKTRAKSAKQERAVFTSEQLETLFRQPLFVGAKGHRGKPLYQPGSVRIEDWRFWVWLSFGRVKRVNRTLVDALGSRLTLAASPR